MPFPARRQSPRILGAIAVVAALHVAALILRFDGSGSGTTADVAPVLSVRMLSPRAVEMAPARLPATAAPAVPSRPALAPDESSAPKPRSPSVTRSGAAAGRPLESTPTTSTAPSAPTAPASLGAAANYALGSKLDPGPRPLDEIDPDYPDVVRLRSGTVTLRLLIGDTGQVDAVDVVSADPPGVFDQAAIDAFAKARFSPGMTGGRPVKSQIRIEVEFMPINRGARTSGRSY